MDLADHAAFDKFLGFGVKNNSSLAADLENAASLFLRFNNHVAVRYFAHHGLLAVNVLTGVESIGRNAGVRRVIGRGDDDGIDIAAGEQVRDGEW